MVSLSNDIDPITRVETLLRRQEAPTSASTGGQFTAFEHALQCAQLAELAHAPDALVAAAFLHDIGHLLLRHWDDLAKEPGRATPPLSYYLSLVRQVHAGFCDDAGAAVNALYVS